VGTGYFTYGVVNDNDQQLQIERATNRGSSVLKVSANWPLGSFVYQPGAMAGAGITYVHNSEFTNINCAGGATNGMVVSDTVCQAFPFFGIRYFGGLQPITIQNVYQETGASVYNPLYAGTPGVAAQMGNLIQGGVGAKILGGFPLTGWTPVFASSGSTERNYWVVPQSSLGTGPMLFIGSAAVNGGTSVPLQWPSIELQDNIGRGVGTLTWDILVTTGISGTAPYGTGNYAVATGVSGACGTNGICSYTDTQSGTSSYTVPGQTFTPVFWFWPATIAANSSTVYADWLASNSFIVATQGTQFPAAVTPACGPGQGFSYTPVVITCLTSAAASGSEVLATVLPQTSPGGNGPAANSKGRLNLTQAIVPPSDLITLADSNLAKTLATAGNRPSNDAGDMALGVDQTGGLAERAATSISSYINAAPSGTNWLERLTAMGKTFNVPLAVNGNLAVSGGTVTLPITGTGSQCLHVSATGAVSGTGADCGNGSGSGTVNSGATSQVAMYSGNGTAVSGDSALTDNGTTLNYTGSGGVAAATGTFSGNVTVNGQLLVAGPWAVSSPIPGTAMAAASAGTSALGISNDGNFYISANGGTPQKVATSATSSYFSNLTQEDANDLGEANGTTPQGLHVYGTYTNASNYERTGLGWDTTDSYFVVRNENAGTGSQRGIGFWIGNGVRWAIDTASAFKPFQSNSFDIGVISPSQLVPRTVYAGTSFDTLTQGRQNFELCNDGTTGTALNFLAKYNGVTPACAVKAGTTDTDGVIGVVSGGSGTSGSAVITYRGWAQCSFDSGTTAGDYVVTSTTNAGDCHDAGTTRPTGAQVLGRVETTNTGAGTYGVRVTLDAPQVIGAPTASPTFTGTVTLPDGSTDTSSGLSGVTIANSGSAMFRGSTSGSASLGVAAAAGSPSKDLLATSDPAIPGAALTEQGAGGGLLQWIWGTLPADVSAFPDSTVQLKAIDCLSTYTVLGGGTCDARGAFLGTQTWNAGIPVVVGELEAPTVTVGTSGSLATGTYRFVITEGSSGPSRETVVTPGSGNYGSCTTGTCSFTVTAPTQYAGTTSWGLYITNGSTGAEKSCGTQSAGVNFSYTSASQCTGSQVTATAASVTLLIPTSGVANASGISDPSGYQGAVANTLGSCYLIVGPQGALLGDSSHTGEWTLNEVSGTVRAGICTEPNAIATGYAKMKGFAVANSGATNTVAAFDVVSVDDESHFDDWRVSSTVNNDVGAGFESLCCRSSAEHFSIGMGGGASGTTGSYDMLVGSANQVSDMRFADFTVNNPSSGQPHVKINSSTTNNVVFDGGYAENHNSTCNQPVFQGASNVKSWSLVNSHIYCAGTVASGWELAYIGSGTGFFHGHNNNGSNPLYVDCSQSGCPSIAGNSGNIPSGVYESGTQAQPAQFNAGVVASTLTASGLTSKTIVGTNTSGQIVDASSATLANNTTGTAAGLSGTPSLPVGSTLASSPSTSDSSTKIATTAWVNAQGYGSGSGNVSGPASSTSGDIATFSGTNGKTIQDSGTALSSLAPLASPTFTGTVTEPVPTLPSQTANQFFAAPNGSNGAPGFRAIVAADIPTLNQNTTGTAAGLSGTPNLPTGTTVNATPTAGDNSTKVATTAYVVATEAGAYGTYTSQIFGTTATTKYGSWTAPAGITVKGFDLYVLTTPSGCSTYPVVQIWDNTAGAEVGSFSQTFNSSSNLYSQVTGSTNVPSGDQLTFKITTAAAGCSTNAGSIEATLTYVMQTH
jgi:hypothetical protein